MHAQSGLRQMQPELKINWRRKNRVSSKDDQQFHFAALQLRNELTERIEFVYRLCRGDGSVIYRAAYVAQKMIQRVRERVNNRCLMCSRDDNAGARALAQVSHERREPLHISLN